MLEQQIGILTKGPSINDVFSKGEGGRGDPHLESMGGGGVEGFRSDVFFRGYQAKGY